MTNPIGTIRSSPSGPFLTGNAGDVPVCLGGSLWRAGPGGGGGGGLTSFNGRVAPAVVPTLGDYTSDLVTNVSEVSGATVSDALEGLSGTLASMTLTTTAPLSGGGALIGNLTLSVASVSNATSGVVPAVGASGTLLKSSGVASSWGSVDPTTLSSFAASPAVNQFLKGNGAGVAASWGTLFSSPANPGDNGKLAVALNGDFVYSLLANANIAANAAISTTKIAPSGVNGQALITTAGAAGWGTDFGAQNLTTTGAVNTGSLAATGAATAASIALGTNPSTTGVLRLQNVGLITARNGANSADVTLLQLGNTNVLTLGLTTGVVGLTVACATGGTISAIIGAVTALSMTAASVQWGVSTMAFPSGAGASLSIAGNNAADGSQLAVTGGNTTFASATGGLLVLGGGASTNATPGLPGGVKIRTDNVEALGTMIEVTRAATARHYVALFGQNTTTAQMGANTGDYVLCVRDAVTVPSADATTGFIHYSDGAKPAWRFNGVNFRLNGTSATASIGGGAAIPATVLLFIDCQVTPVGGGAAVQGKIPVFAA